jgi:hypothetical protein
MQAYIRPLREGIASLRALMKSALPLLNKTSASMAVSTFRVWGSRSDRSCHQRDHPSHRAVGCLNLVASTSSLVGLKPVTLWTSEQPILLAARLTPVDHPMAPARGFSSPSHDRHHPDSATPTRSAQSCSPPPPLSDSTLDAEAAPVSIGCDDLFAAPPSEALPVPRG